MKDPSQTPLTLAVTINGADLVMEVDTGAAASIISETTFRRLWADAASSPSLQKTNMRLRTYTGEMLAIKGSISVNVCCRNVRALLDLLVVAGTGPSLMGRNWLHKLKPTLSVFHTRADNDEQELLGRHVDLFKDELGLLKAFAVTIQVKASAKPSFYKPRTVPFALRGKVKQELDRLERMGVIEAVTFSEWAAPIVPIVKQDSSIRICGDYKLTVNRVADLESYPLPRIDDLLASVGKGQVFSKLDLANAYLQLALDEDSKKFVTISTQQGLYRYNRLPFGVASAPAIFQRTMEGLLGDIHNVYVYLDDILVSGSSRSEHLLTLEKVLS